MAAPASAVKGSPAAPKKIPQWMWEARTKAGDLKKGEMEANDAAAVDARLKQLGLSPVKVKKKAAELSFSIPGVGGVAQRDVLIFTRQFATMIDAGLPL